MMPPDLEKLIGKSFVFEDGATITVTQIKLRDEGIYWITYMTKTGPGIPVRYVMIGILSASNIYQHIWLLI